MGTHESKIIYKKCSCELCSNEIVNIRIKVPVKKVCQEIPADRPVHIIKYVDRPVPVTKYVDRPVHIIKYIDRPIFVERIIPEDFFARHV
jgi:hypothetical protein